MDGKSVRWTVTFVNRAAAAMPVKPVPAPNSRTRITGDDESVPAHEVVEESSEGEGGGEGRCGDLSLTVVEAALVVLGDSSSLGEAGAKLPGVEGGTRFGKCLAIM